MLLTAPFKKISFLDMCGDGLDQTGSHRGSEGHPGSV